VSLARIRAAIKAGAVRVNGRKTIQGWVLKAGDRVSYDSTLGPSSAEEASLPPLEVLYEDAELLVINKPVGVQAHPVGTEQSSTLVNALAAHVLNHSAPSKELTRPMLLHRLDRDTSGVLVVAKTPHAARTLSKDFQERRVTKRYLALVHGVMQHDSGEIDAPIGESKRERPHWRVSERGSPAQTRFAVKERFAAHTLVELEPLTGRTHQLRIHAAHIGHPIVGDRIYKGEARRLNDDVRAKHQLLHAHSLTLRHPATGREMTFTAPLPKAMRDVLEALRKKPS
jgi:23S rRNA pseudouridine1911/1915/1917 synthase